MLPVSLGRVFEEAARQTLTKRSPAELFDSTVGKPVAEAK